MKYIDAEKLKAEIEKRYDNMLERAKLDSDNANYWNGKAEAYRAIYDHIDSLQQEQNSIQDVELTSFESALFTAFSYAWQSYLMGEKVNVAQWAKENSAELLEAARCQHERPKVDLEKEIRDWIGDNGSKDDRWTWGECNEMIRYFYELGLRRAAEMYDDIEYNRQRAEEENK